MFPREVHKHVTQNFLRTRQNWFGGSDKFLKFSTSLKHKLFLESPPDTQTFIMYAWSRKQTVSVNIKI